VNATTHVQVHKQGFLWFLTQKLIFLWQDGSRMEGKGTRGGRCCCGKKSKGINGLEKMWVVQILGTQRDEGPSEVA
jgi:hypothetical protein